MQGSIRLLTQEMDQLGTAPLALSSIHRRARNALAGSNNTSSALRDITNVHRSLSIKAEKKNTKRQRVRVALQRRILQREQPLIPTIHHVIDIDKKDESKDALAHAENLAAAEARYALDLSLEDVLKRNHSDMKAFMPNTICSWMFEVCFEVDLEMGTFVLGTKLFQRCLALSEAPIAPNSLQLYGIICLYLAFKFTETSKKLSFRNLTNLGGGEWTSEELREKELEVFKALDYRLCVPTPLHFLDRIVTAASVHDSTNTFIDHAGLHKSILFYIHIASSDMLFFDYAPSLVAAAATALGRAVHNLPIWNQTFLHYSGHSQEEISTTIDMLVGSVMNSPADPFSWKFGQGANSEVIRLAVATSNGALNALRE